MSNQDSELFDFMLGRKIGYGVYREVFNCRFNDKYVVKVANGDGGRSANILEYKLWSDMYLTPLEKWFAPVMGVSESGKYLIQEKVEMLPKSQYPEKIPHFFTDTKYSNFGHLEGKGFVCVDFGSFNIFKGVSTRMVKAEWWE